MLWNVLSLFVQEFHKQYLRQISGDGRELVVSDHDEAEDHFDL